MSNPDIRNVSRAMCNTSLDLFFFMVSVIFSKYRLSWYIVAFPCWRLNCSSITVFLFREWFVIGWRTSMYKAVFHSVIRVKWRPYSILWNVLIAKSIANGSFFNLTMTLCCCQWSGCMSYCLLAGIREKVRNDGSNTIIGIIRYQHNIHGGVLVCQLKIGRK